MSPEREELAARIASNLVKGGSYRVVGPYASTDWLGLFRTGEAPPGRVRAGVPGGTRATSWAEQAMRLLQRGFTGQDVANKLAVSLRRPRIKMSTATGAQAAAGSGFGGGGWSGAPSTVLGKPMTAGNYIAPAPPVSQPLA